jgi:hypothetical protein
MSEELKDLRCKISVLSACYLEAEARAQGVDKCQLVRSILDGWASRRHGAFMTAQRLLAAEGQSGAVEGMPGIAVAGGASSLRWDD